MSVNTIVNGLRDLGYVDGKTATIVFRAARGAPDMLPRLAAELVARKVDVVYAVGPAAVRAALDVALGIPIVALDFGNRSGASWVGTQPCAAGR